MENDKDTDVKSYSYILNFYIINQNTDEIFYKWYFFDNTKDFLGFIKYIALPSGYYSRIAREVVTAADSYDNVIELLYNSSKKADEMLISNFTEDFSKIEDAEKNFSLKGLKSFCNSFNSHLDFFNGTVFSRIEIYENIKELGLELAAVYEEDRMIYELEKKMKMSREEIADFFSNIENNTFMIKNINKFLNSKALL